MTTGGAAKTDVALPASLRRRAAGIGRAALEAAVSVMPDGTEARIFASSRHGEYDRTLRLLTELAETGETSPADFSMSVHHALAGLLSIAVKNRQGHSAIAAGRETLCCALLDAALFTAETGAPSVVMHYDAPIPAEYGLTDDVPAPQAVAVLLTQHPPLDGMEILMRMDCGVDEPQISAADAFAAVLTGRSDEAGFHDRNRWRWARVA